MNKLGNWLMTLTTMTRYIVLYRFTVNKQCLTTNNVSQNTYKLSAHISTTNIRFVTDEVNSLYTAFVYRCTDDIARSTFPLTE